MQPKVSVLTTVYNREKYLRECIESVQNGRFQDYEHIIVDDGSTDNSQSIAYQMAKIDERIKVHVNPSNLGDYPNRNRAASLASGQYLKYLDADDWQGRWALEVMVDAMDQFPEAGIGLFDDPDKIHPFPKLISGQEAIERYYKGQSRLLNRSPLNAMIRKSAFQTVGGFKPERMTGDFDMWHRMAKTYPVVLFPNRLNCYRKHEGQETQVTSNDPLTGVRYLTKSLEHLRDKNTPINHELRNESTRRLERQLARTILVYLKKGEFQNSRAVQKELGWKWKTVLQNAFS